MHELRGAHPFKIPNTNTNIFYLLLTQLPFKQKYKMMERSRQCSHNLIFLKIQNELPSFPYSGLPSFHVHVVKETTLCNIHTSSKPCNSVPSTGATAAIFPLPITVPLTLPVTLRPAMPVRRLMVTVTLARSVTIFTLTFTAVGTPPPLLALTITLTGTGATTLSASPGTRTLM